MGAPHARRCVTNRAGWYAHHLGALPPNILWNSWKLATVAPYFIGLLGSIMHIDFERGKGRKNELFMKLSLKLNRFLRTEEYSYRIHNGLPGLKLLKSIS